MRYWPFVRGNHRSPINSPHKDQWRGALMFSLICAWISGWVNNHECGDLRRRRAHYDVAVMKYFPHYWSFVRGIRRRLRPKMQSFCCCVFFFISFFVVFFIYPRQAVEQTVELSMIWCLGSNINEYWCINHENWLGSEIWWLGKTSYVGMTDDMTCQ